MSTSQQFTTLLFRSRQRTKHAGKCGVEVEGGRIPTTDWFLQLKGFLTAPFLSHGRINSILLTLFIIINGLVLLNAIIHDPRIGYDAREHLKYVQSLSKFILPTHQDSKEFFSPPLTYFIPSLIYMLSLKLFSLFNASGVMSFTAETFSLLVAAKAGQFLNLFYSLGLTFFLLKICEIIRPEQATFKITSLFILGMIPVYYKTFAFIRGEPLLAFLMVLITYWFLKIVFVDIKRRSAEIIFFGVTLGLLVLARQWGFFLFPAIGLFISVLSLKTRPFSLSLIKMTLLAFIISAMVGGWFYLVLKERYGRFTAFPRDPINTSFSFSDQTSDFYFGLGNNYLFRDPIRDNFPNQFIPIFYSEIWGDYWGYFIWNKTEMYRDNADQRKMLGRVNLVSLFPTLILLAGLAVGLIYLLKFLFQDLNIQSRQTTIFPMFEILIIVSFIGYFWFLIRYPHVHDGDTIKATYVIYLFPFLSMLAGEFLERVKSTDGRLYLALLLLLLLTAVHNIPVMISRFV